MRPPVGTNERIRSGSRLAALHCRAGDRVFAIPIAHVVETMRPLPIEPHPNPPSFVIGVSVVRGEPLPVLDAARLLGGADARPTRFVTLRVADRQVVLAVEAIVGVRDIPPGSLRTLPPLLAGAADGVVASLGTLDAQLLLVLRAVHLVPEEAA